jgi:hypothetical protein
MQLIMAPSAEKAKFKTLFLAGGITNCPDWQAEIARRLEDRDITIHDPRRRKFPKGRAAERKQIQWEYERLRSADLVSFWFPSESLDPITLFELGSALERNAKLVIGVHPGYQREFDVKTQVSLKLPRQKICRSLGALTQEIKKTLKL